MAQAQRIGVIVGVAAGIVTVAIGSHAILKWIYGKILLDEVTTEIKHLEARIEQQDREIEKLIGEKSKLEEDRESKFELQTQMIDIKHGLNAAQDQNKELTRQIDALEQVKRDMKAAAEATELELEQARAENIDLRKKADRSEGTIEELASKIDLLEGSLESSRRKLEELLYIPPSRVVANLDCDNEYRNSCKSTILEEYKGRRVRFRDIVRSVDKRVITIEGLNFHKHPVAKVAALHELQEVEQGICYQFDCAIETYCEDTYTPLSNEGSIRFRDCRIVRRELSCNGSR